MLLISKWKVCPISIGRMRYHRVESAFQIDVLGVGTDHPLIALPTPESIAEEERGDDLFPRRGVPY
jgi:hypothetical protein